MSKFAMRSSAEEQLRPPPDADTWQTDKRRSSQGGLLCFFHLPIEVEGGGEKNLPI